MKNLYPTSFRAWLTVIVLMLAYILSFVDRQILNLLVDPIRRDMAITDTQMSLLMGFSFAVFYTICGIPLGRVADSKNRRNLIAMGILAWSVMTAACGMVKNYWQFLFCRIGVAAGEACLAPGAYSMISDSFPSHRRATAFSVYSMAIYLGSGVALLLGGLVVHFTRNHDGITLPLVGAVHSWQLVFLVLGAVGVAFAFIVLLLLREPSRQGVGAGVTLPLSEVYAYFRKNRRTILHHNLGFAFMAFSAYGSGAWIPTFFRRTFDMSVPEVGIIYGSIVAVFGSAGLYTGGRIADWLHSRGHTDASLRIGILAVLLTLPFNLAYLVDDKMWALILIALHVYTISMPFGVGPHAIQEIMPNSMRGQASAVYQFALTMIGLGIGPTAVALSTDYLFQDDMALRYSLAVITGVSLVITLFILWRGLKPYRDTVEDLKNWRVSSSSPSSKTVASPAMANS